LSLEIDDIASNAVTSVRWPSALKCRRSRARALTDPETYPVGNGLSASARIDALNKVVPDGVRGVFETEPRGSREDLLKGLTLVGRTGGPTSGDTKGIDAEFKHLA
jgi:hypothetical protein